MKTDVEYRNRDYEVEYEYERATDGDFFQPPTGENVLIDTITLLKDGNRHNLDMRAIQKTMPDFCGYLHQQCFLNEHAVYDMAMEAKYDRDCDR